MDFVAQKLINFCHDNFDVLALFFGGVTVLCLMLRHLL